MKYALIVMAGIIAFLVWYCWSLRRELRRRDVIVEDLAEMAAEISAKTHVSYDTAFQSLVTLTYTMPGRIRKR